MPRAWVLVGLAPATGIGAHSTEETLNELLDSVAGRQYWARVQVRNVGGLWSDVASMPFVAGQETIRNINCLPILMKQIESAGLPL